MTISVQGRSRRAELGDFLKARRAQVSPADVGLPPGPRRRTPGLRREEVAQLAGVGVTWYTWLEQGRPINVSSQVLDAVARTLGLSPPERTHLYRLTESTPARPAPEVCPDDSTLVEILMALDPLPAVISNTRFDILKVNEPFRNLFHDWHSLPCVHKNLLWCIVTEPRARQSLLNYDTEVPYLVARLRSAYGEHLGDPVWEEDIARLCNVSPEFEELWSRHEVAAGQPRPRHVMHPIAGELHLTVTEMTLPAYPDLRLFVETPADAQTRARLPLATQPPPT